MTGRGPVRVAVAVLVGTAVAVVVGIAGMALLPLLPGAGGRAEDVRAALGLAPYVAAVVILLGLPVALVLRVYSGAPIAPRTLAIVGAAAGTVAAFAFPVGTPRALAIVLIGAAAGAAGGTTSRLVETA